MSPTLTALALAVVAAGCGGDAERGGVAVEQFDSVATTLEGLAAAYTLDGHADDAGPQSWHGALNGATLALDRFGRDGFAASFDGADDYFSLPAHAIGESTQSFTVSLWFATDTQREGTLFAEAEVNGQGMWLRIDPDGDRLLAHGRDAFTLQTDGAYNDGAWHHLVLRASDKGISLWIDAQMVVEDAWSPDFALATTPATTVFGREGAEGSKQHGRYYEGAMDDVAIFHRPLSGGEIKSLFKEGPNREPTANAAADWFGFDVTIDASASTDVDGEIVSYVVDFGDGTEPKEGDAVAEHTYAEPGEYEVRVIVMDDEGATSETTVTIEVTDPTDHGDAGPWPADWATMEQEVLYLVNQRRAEGASCGGEPYAPAGPLEMNSFTRISSRDHSEDMAEQGYFAHEGLNGSTPFDRMAAAGFEGAMPWGENIAAGQTNAAQVVQGWMDSPGHCRNIMNADYKVMGVGYFFSASSPMGHYWTQNFGGSH